MRRYFVLFLLLAIVAAGCAPNEPELELDVLPVAPTAVPTIASSAVEPTLVERTVVSFGVQQWAWANYKPLADAFNATNTDVEVRLVLLSESITDDWVRAAVTKADVVATNLVGAKDIANGYFRDLTPFVDGDSSFDRNDFYPNLLAPEGADSRIYQIPSDVSVPLIHYNKRLWQNANMPEPALDWSWDDLLLAAEQLRSSIKTQDGVAYGSALEPLGLIPLYGVLSQEAPLQSNAITELLEQPAVLTAFERTARLWQSGAVYALVLPNQETPNMVSYETIGTLIGQERIGMWDPIEELTNPSVGGLRFEVGVALRPPLGSYDYQDRWGYAMSDGTQYPEVAWRWISFLSHQPVDLYPNQVQFVPARQSVAEHTQYWQGLDDRTSAAVRAGLARSYPRLELFNESVYFTLMAVRDAIVNYKQTPAQALAQAATEARQASAQAQAITPEPIVVATPRPRPAANQIVVRFDGSFLPQERLDVLVATFNQQQQNISVQTFNAVSEQARSFSSTASGSDCFSWPNTPQGEESATALDLQPFLDGDASFSADVPAPLLNTLRRNGRLHGLPYEVRFRMLAYDPQLFDAAGLPYPTASWGINDLAQNAEALTRGAGASKQFGLAAPGTRLDELREWLQLSGVQATGSSAVPTPNFTDPALVKTLKRYVALVQQAAPAPRLQGYAKILIPTEDRSLIEAQRVGMWFIAGQDVADDFNRSRDSYRVVAAPFGLGGIDYDAVDISGLFISASSPNAAACWQWFKFLANDALLIGQAFPARRSLAESPAFQNSIAEDARAVYETYLVALDNTTALVPTIFDNAELSLYWFYRAIDRALQGGDLERELTDAQFVTEQYLACVRSGEAAKTCVTTVDPQYDGFAAK